MRNKTKMLSALIKPIAMLLVLIFLLVATSYAWIKRNWQPTIEQKGLTVSTGGSLAFKLSNSAPATTYFSINDAFPSYSGDFELRAISSLSGDGTDFFNISRDGDGKAIFNKVFETADNADDNGYIHVSFIVVSNEADINSEQASRYTRYVYFSPDTVLEDTVSFAQSAAAALRISLTTTASTSTSTNTILLWNREEGTVAARESHIAVDPRLREGAGSDHSNANVFYAHGKEVPEEQFEFDNDLHERNYDIKPLDYYCGFKKTNGEIDETSPDPDRCLFSISAGDTRNVVLRIWLEGQDKNCTDQLAARQINMKLIFSSYLYDTVEGKIVGEQSTPAEEGESS